MWLSFLLKELRLMPPPTLTSLVNFQFALWLVKQQTFCDLKEVKDQAWG